MATEATAEVAAAVEEVKPVETKPEAKPETQQGQTKHVITVNGQTYEATAEEMAVLASKGLAAHLAEREAAGKEPDPKAADGEEEDETTKRITKLEQQLVQERQAKLLETIDDRIESSGIPAKFHVTLRKSIIFDIGSNPKGNFKELIANNIKEMKAMVADGATKVDAEKKLAEQKELAVSTASGNSAGDNPPAVKGRSSFRDGSLAASVAAEIRKLSK